MKSEIETQKRKNSKQQTTQDMSKKVEWSVFRRINICNSKEVFGRIRDYYGILFQFPFFVFFLYHFFYANECENGRI